VNEIETSIEALETRNAFQDDVIEQLNNELSIHQSQIADLKHQLALIANRLKEATPSEESSQSVEPPPPHY
jgi:SlyX protein